MSNTQTLRKGPTTLRQTHNETETHTWNERHTGRHTNRDTHTHRHTHTDTQITHTHRSHT